MKMTLATAAFGARLFILGVVLAIFALWAAGSALAADVAELEKSLKPGNEALLRLLPTLDRMAGPMSRDVLHGKADLHAFYGMVMARVFHEQCQDTIALMRSAQAQECPALDAALSKRLADSAGRLEGAVELVAGSLLVSANPKIRALGLPMLEAYQLYLRPLKEFAGSQERREL